MMRMISTLIICFNLFSGLAFAEKPSTRMLLNITETEASYWIIVFYQIVVAQPEGRIEFSGVEMAYKMVNNNTSDPLLKRYNDQISCEKDLKDNKGNNEFLVVNSFHSKTFGIVTDKDPLNNSKRTIVNAFQCMKINV